MKFKYRWWGKGDIDASIGIFFDGFSKILSATGIMLFVFGMPADIVLGKIVPGVGLAIFAGNLWYFYEAWALAKKEQRQDVTAQPFGIGASQLTGWLYLIMGPVYWQTGDAELAFQVGLAASLIGGFIEVLGGFIGRWLVKGVPHSALMGNMASSALVWLSFVGIAMVFDKPLYALLPFCMVVIDYLGKADKRFQKIPTGVVAVVLGAVIAWCGGYLTWDNFTSSFGSNAVAAMGIAQKINSVTVQIALGLSQGIMPLISYNYASGNIKRMKKTFFFTARIALVFLVLMEIAYYAGARTWVGLFMQDQQIVDYGARFLQGFCLGMPFLAIDFLAVGVFQACGLGKNAFLFAILRKVVLEIPALFLLNALFPLYGLAYAQFAAEVVLAVASVAVLVRLFRKWEKRYQKPGGSAVY